jgi:glyoxylase-like metal-dependent hydrolase (beta-lactamase superfamily II)/rhodanese-related sulfurtransferase
MILKPYYLGCLSHASYLVGDEAAGVAAVVDPQRDVDQYVRDAARLGVAIRHVVLTHFHADFVSGHLELRERTGATIHLGARGTADYPHVPARDGDAIDLGKVRLTVLETPGHTPESVCVLVTDLAKGATKPHAVFTGDTLFIGDVGRPDLLASVGASAADLAGQLYDSVHGTLLALPDETLVYPAHGAGSMCGRNLSSETVSTIGAQRRANDALRPMPKEEFVRLVSSGQPDAPAYFAYDADLNRRERPTLEGALAAELVPLAPPEFLARRSGGATVLDVRDPPAYARSHLRGSVNIGLGGKFATWAGTVLDRAAPILLVAEPGRETEAATRLGRIGFDRVVGYAQGGFAPFAGRADLLASTERIDAREMAARLARRDPPLVIDVRTPAEWAGRRVGESLNLPLNRLRERMAEVPRDRPFVLHCQSAYRSSIAASLLEGAGRSGFAELTGGFSAWEAAGMPTAASAVPA